MVIISEFADLVIEVKSIVLVNVVLLVIEKE